MRPVFGTAVLLLDSMGLSCKRYIESGADIVRQQPFLSERHIALGGVN